MGVASVAGVDHMHVVATQTAQVVGDQVRGAARRVPYDEHVGVHGHQVINGIEQGLALGRRGTGHVEVDHVCRQALGGDLESRSRTGGILEEDVEDALATQQGHLFDLAVRDLEEARCGIQDAVSYTHLDVYKRQT